MHFSMVSGQNLVLTELDVDGTATVGHDAFVEFLLHAEEREALMKWRWSVRQLPPGSSTG